MPVLIVASLLTDMLEMENNNNKKLEALPGDPDSPHCECHEKSFSRQEPQVSDGACFIQYQFPAEGRGVPCLGFRWRRRKV